MKSTKKFLATSTAVIIAASAIVPAASAASFKDIKGNAHENAIISLADQGIIGGYPDGTFKPNQNLTRSDVVKLLGKYLVSLGHEIPTDYKTKMRFTDLTAKSQDELLQYAALVKDLGVFQGSAGQLLHKDQLRRDQMATVLVRAFKVINEYDYVAPMNEAEYKSTITDLTKTTAEHQEAIKTLAYHGVTKQATFSPKDPTKRGQFASFLYNMLKVNVPKPAPVEPPKPVLTIKAVEVQGPDKLRVVLSDDKAYIVTLKTPLVENVETEVTFEVGDKSYTTKVKYEVPDLKVASITNPNGGQIAITFNQPVKLDAELNAAAIKKLVTMTGIDLYEKVDLTKGTLSDDKRTLTVTANSLKGISGRYHIVVEGIESATARKLVKFDDVVSFGVDKTSPTVAGVEAISATKVKVKFTEAVKKPITNTQFKLANGTVVDGITGSIENGATEVIYDLSEARANGVLLAPGTMISVNFGTIIDLSNNLSSPNPLITYITKGDKDGVLPTLALVTQLGSTKFKLTFSEELRTISPDDLNVVQNMYPVAILKIDQDEKDKKSFIITTANTLNSYATISTKPGRFITDLSGEVNTFTTNHQFIVDTKVPALVNTAVVKEKGMEYLEFTFDRALTVAPNATVQLAGSYMLNGYTHNLTTTLIDHVKLADKQDRVLRVPMNTLLNESLNSTIYAGYQYLVNATFTGVYSEFNQPVSNATNISFTRGVDSSEEKLAVKKVITKFNYVPGDVNNYGYQMDNNTVIISFNTNIDGGTGWNKDNYFIQNANIEKATINVDERDKVYLTLKPNTIAQSISSVINVKNLKAINSTQAMDDYVDWIFLNENIAPKHITSYVNGNEIVLLFDDQLKDVKNSAFNVFNTTTQQYEQISEVKLSQTDKEITIKLSGVLRAGDSITVSESAQSTITDQTGNKIDFPGFTFRAQ